LNSIKNDCLGIRQSTYSQVHSSKRQADTVWSFLYITCFIYDNPRFEVIEQSTNYEQVKTVVEDAAAKGVEQWQVNFKITPYDVKLDRYFRLP